MGTVYKRGPFWWAGFKLPGAKHVYRSTGISSDRPKSEALKVLAAIEKELSSGARLATNAKTTVAEWALKWTAQRVDNGQTNAEKDLTRLKAYVFAALGAKRLSAVTTGEVREMLRGLRRTKLAPRTIINTYGLVHRLFADAVAEELIVASPCVLRRGDLPKKRDKNPDWRHEAVFSREETELLLSHASIPLDRRVTYALGLLGGMREGEISALRWSSIDRSTTGLWRISVTSSFTRNNKKVKSTKTERPRGVPAHPVLQRLLRQWEAEFVTFFGRAPEPTDLLVPNRNGAFRTDNSFLKGLKADLKKLGLRHRRMHDTRRTFITLGRTDGANRDVLRTITHDQKGDQFDEYTSFDWAAKCEAVMHLKINGHPMRINQAATGTLTTRPTTIEADTVQTTQNNSALFNGQEGTRSRLRGVATGSESDRSTTCESSESRRGPVGVVSRSNVVNDSVVDALESALDAYRLDGSKQRLAARLRVVLTKVR